MPPLSYRAIAIAFLAELAADLVIGIFVLILFAGDELTAGMDQAAFDALAGRIVATTAYVPWMMALGTATTIGGAYLAARIAKRIPYYHGLAMGIVGIIYMLVSWNNELFWPNVIGLIVTIPASLYGAHLAKRHMPAGG